MPVSVEGNRDISFFYVSVFSTNLHRPPFHCNHIPISENTKPCPQPIQPPPLQARYTLITIHAETGRFAAAIQRSSNRSRRPFWHRSTQRLHAAHVEAARGVRSDVVERSAVARPVGRSVQADVTWRWRYSRRRAAGHCCDGFGTRRRCFAGRFGRD